MATKKTTTTTSRSEALAAVLSPTLAERREAPRLKLPRVDAQVVSAGLPAKVLDIGFGGVSIESTREFKVDELHMLRAGTSAQDAAPLRVRVKHCRQQPTTNRKKSYVTGFEFVDPWCPGDYSPADEFISQVTKALSQGSPE